ncbi:helix-turn-helix transcriptional regulator [Kaistella sp.]|uniref:helix-turn-helix transcriptional regulator n=1 Tax=Kaistella sp. TaxID=2782235 RepID=UPI003C472810
MEEDLQYFKNGITASAIFELDEKSEYTLAEINLLGDMLPASLMLHRIENFQPTGVFYMNNWGLKGLNKSLEEIENLGDQYYDLFFEPHERKIIFKEIENYLLEGDFTKQYNFFQRVKFEPTQEYMWFLSVCKLIKIKSASPATKQMLMLASPMQGMDQMIIQMNKILEENNSFKKEQKNLIQLTPQERLIVNLIIQGKSSKEIADELCLSIHTIHTHRKNIKRKTDCENQAALARFAIVAGWV